MSTIWRLPCKATSVAEQGHTNNRMPLQLRHGVHTAKDGSLRLAVLMCPIKRDLSSGSLLAGSSYRFVVKVNILTNLRRNLLQCVVLFSRPEPCATSPLASPCLNGIGQPLRKMLCPKGQPLSSGTMDNLAERSEWPRGSVTSGYGGMDRTAV